MALKFFWRCEGTTLDPTDDFSASDTTASLINSATISTTAVRIGTNGILGAASVASAATFTSSGIFPGTAAAPSDSVGCMACSYQFKVAVPGTGQQTGLRFRGAVATDQIGIETSGTSDIRLSIGNATTTLNLATSGAGLVFDAWYGIVARWDLPNNKRKIEVYDASNVLITSAEDTATNLAAAIPSEVNNAFSCGIKSNSNANTTWCDCCMVGNSYNDPLQNNLTKSSYTLYDGSLGGGLVLGRRIYVMP